MNFTIVELYPTPTMAYVPPHMRNKAVDTSKTPARAMKAQRRQERHEFPLLEGFVAQKPIEVKVNWTGIDFTDEEITEKEAPLPTGWIDLRYFEADTSLTTEQLHRAEQLLHANWIRYYVEHGEEIPTYFLVNPYEKFADFDQQIPLYNEYESSDSESSEGDYEDPEYESE
jgi:hypothetical protein